MAKSRPQPFLFILLVCSCIFGQGQAPSAQDLGLSALAGGQETVTRHTIETDGRVLAYTARIGSISLPEGATQSTAQLIYTSYVLDGTDLANRPISFVINGGPGAASAYLHLGALGPQRLVFGQEGRVPTPPSRLEPNDQTWLAFTDLVFIDPVGTGFSRSTADPELQDRGAADREFWTVDRDLKALGGFIRQYLARHGRWQSPKVLVGESYGGFRMAAMAERLPSDFEVALNGILLVSPALELGLQNGSEWDLLPWILRVPSMAAVARAHGKAPGEISPTPRDALAEVESFVLGPLLLGLARGAAMPEAEAEMLYERLAGYIGLESGDIARERGRLSSSEFAANLLETERRTVSLYDGVLDAPRAPGRRGQDAYLSRLTAAFAGAFADYIRRDLGFTIDAPYLVLNREVFRHWSWDERGGRGRVGAADELAQALSADDQLRVLVTHGVHDLVTPYFTSVYLMNQLVHDDEVRERMRLVAYPGGHMFYSRDDSLAMFRADAARFFGEVTGTMTPGG
jgi:carboxypeptidase C (cathepsin A)